MEQKFQIGTTECIPITQLPHYLWGCGSVLSVILWKNQSSWHTHAQQSKAQQCLIEAATEADVCEFVERSVRHYYLMRQRPFLKRVRDVYAGGFSTALRTELGAISNANTNKNKN